MAKNRPKREDSWSGRPRDISGLRLVRQFEARIAPAIRRAHLPRNPWGPWMLAASGLLGMLVVGGLAEPMAGGRAVAAAQTIFVSAAMILPLAMLLSGAWDLARGPLEYFAPRWHARLTATDP